MAKRTEAALTVVEVRRAVRTAYRALEGRRQEINDLNVYPVPDGDTGTNLSLTVKSVVEGLDGLDEDAVPAEVARTLAEAALMGARGNSGVILSQIVRGAVEILKKGEPLDAGVVVRALGEARDAAYRAVRKPVEGTMLTVIKDMAGAAEARSELPLGEMWEAVVAAGWESVRKTPALLKVLRDAGVVDAGGYGLVAILEGVAGEDIQGDVQTGSPGNAFVAARPEGGEELSSRFTYCTSFLLSGQGLDPAVLEERLTEMGDSLLVVGDGSQVKVHVHTDHPGDVLNEALGRGVLSGIEIDNMREQTAQRDERLRAAELGDAEQAEEEGGEDSPARVTDIVAVVTGEGNAALYRSMGVDFIVEGGQSMNPSAEELLQMVGKSDAGAVILLPNNKNIVMTAEHAAAHTDRTAFVLPSHSIQAGLSALVVYDPAASGEGNVQEMRGVLEEVRTGEVTRAVRDSRVDGMSIKAGAFIGLVDERVVVTSIDFEEVVRGVVSRLVTGETEVLTLLLGEGDASAAAREAAERLKDDLDDVDVEIYEGGQAFYPILMAAE